MATHPGSRANTSGTMLAIVIPAYNEEATIADAINALPSKINGADSVRVFVIDDGSTDDTGRRAEEAGATVVSHHRNLGLASAFRSAIRICLEEGATIAVTMDADLQFSPNDIPALIAPILNGRADFVAGDRFQDTDRPRHMPRVKYYGNRIMTKVVNSVTGATFTDVSSGFRAYSREALLNLNIQSSFTYTQESFIELAAKGLRIEQVPVHVTYFPDRQSHISGSIIRYTFRTLLTIARTTRDYAPLTIFGTAGGVALAPGLVLGAFIIIHYIVTGSFTPYIFLALGAAYLTTLGIGLLVLALVADMLRGIRSNQERLLYFSKRSEYGDTQHRP